MKTFEEWRDEQVKKHGPSFGGPYEGWHARDAEVIEHKEMAQVSLDQLSQALEMIADKDLTITRLKDILGEHAASGEETSEDAYQNYLKWITKFSEIKTQVADKDRTIARVREILKAWHGPSRSDTRMLDSLTALNKIQAVLEGKQ